MYLGEGGAYIVPQEVCSVIMINFIQIERRRDRMFKSVLSVGDERYSSSYW